MRNDTPADLPKLLEYRVRPITRYAITRYHQDEHGGGCSMILECDSEDTAINLAALLTKSEDGAVLLDGFGQTTDAAWVDEILANWKR